MGGSFIVATNTLEPNDAKPFVDPAPPRRQPLDGMTPGARKVTVAVLNETGGVPHLAFAVSTGESSMCR